MCAVLIGRQTGGGAQGRDLMLFLFGDLHEIVTFERQHQYCLLFSRLEADQHKFCELQQSGTVPCLFTLMSTLHHFM